MCHTKGFVHLYICLILIAGVADILETAGLLDKGAGWPAGKGSRLEETAGLLDKGAGWPAEEGSRREEKARFKSEYLFPKEQCAGGSRRYFSLSIFRRERDSRGSNVSEGARLRREQFLFMRYHLKAFFGRECWR